MAWRKRPSIPFDQAVEYYDRTRSLSPEAAAQAVRQVQAAYRIGDTRPAAEPMIHRFVRP